MLNAYPRPQLKRDSFYCLNGDWEFAINDGAVPSEYPYTICVPYPPESAASGLMRRIHPSEALWYRNVFSLPDGFVKSRVLLHFGAVDQYAEVYLNDQKIGSHKGGYLPFYFDITNLIKERNELILCAHDPLDHTYPWGKQKNRNGGMWYTPFSGIWQTVWLESVPETYITDIRYRPSLSDVTVSVETNSPVETVHFEIETQHGVVTFDSSDPTSTIEIPDPMLWSPESPHLYPIWINIGEDTVRSYFALRTITSAVINGIPRLCLNGHPYYFHGVLDQGYWPEGICLPPDDGGYERDVRAVKSLGFNMIRKHIRIEPLPFYEACDRLGVLVLQDFVNNGDYHFIRDTVLPTIGVKRILDRFRNRDRQTRKIFTETAQASIRHLYNAPCIFGWTVFNEGWGQFCADEVYDLLKPLDPDRIFDSTSGWFRRHKSDVRSEHVYFRRFRPKRSSLPLLLSEFGGYVYASSHQKEYGYRFFHDLNAYRDALKSLYLNEIVPSVSRGLCGSVYTQLSDVEEEKNGIMSYDRSIVKPDAETMQEIAKMLFEAMYTSASEQNN